MSNKNFNLQVWLPFMLSFSVGIGVFIGFTIHHPFAFRNIDANSAQFKKQHFSKVEEVLRFVQARYLEDIELDQLQDVAIDAILAELDPHSSYIPLSEVQSVKESLKGNFEGIGIEFYMVRDTLMVVGVMPEGPSEKKGVTVGDRILKVDGKPVSGQKLNNKQIIELIKGKEGSKVQVELFRKSNASTIQLQLERAKIPLLSVETSYMIDSVNGYIKISKFTEQTFEEFMGCFEKLVESKMKNLILDLRDNPGGYLNEAVDILNQIFNEKRLLVYTEGRSYKRKEYKSNGRAYFSLGKITVLINEGSASASEIVAGAIQDNDRGLVIGRRSFGKGLVQEQYDLSDSSALRLTVARYFTPSGRLIQRKYKNLEENYSDEILNRFYKGELSFRDSIKIQDSTQYFTTGGRIVYAGGGIIPDIFIPVDTLDYNNSFLQMKEQVSPFVYQIMDMSPGFLAALSTPEKIKQFKVSDLLFNEFLAFCLNQGLIIPNHVWIKSKKRILQELKAQLCKQNFGVISYYQVLNEADPLVQRAVKEMK